MKIRPSVLRLLFVFLIAASSSSLSGQITPTRQVSVSGTATVFVVPDEALIDFSIIVHDDDLTQARLRNKERSTTVIDYLRKSGVNERHIQTKRMTLGVRYNDRHREEGKYHATQSFSICIVDLSLYEDILTELIGLGVSQVNGPTFRTTELREHKDEARRMAIRAAKEKAELMAAELQASVGEVLSITEGNINARGNSFQNAYATAPQGSSEDESAGFASGELLVTAEVQLTFELK